MQFTEKKASSAMSQPARDDDDDKFLMGGDKIPSASFLSKGDTHEGVILDKFQRQQTDIKTRELKFFPDGGPRMSLVVVLQTEEIDEDIEDDDGRRQIWLDFNKRKAVADAVKEADAPGLRIGGRLSLTMTGQAKPAAVGLSGAKSYTATYVAPSEDNSSDDAFLNDGDPDEAEAPKPAKKAAAKAAPPKPTAEPKHHGPWVEDDYHYEDDDGNKFFAVDGEWVDYIAPPVAKKAAKKAPPKPPSNDEDSF